jgi:hypothetical protein
MGQKYMSVPYFVQFKNNLYAEEFTTMLGQSLNNKTHKASHKTTKHSLQSCQILHLKTSKQHEVHIPCIQNSTSSYWLETIHYIIRVFCYSD